MKKLSCSLLAVASLLGLLFVGNILYQRHSLKDGMTLITTHVHGGGGTYGMSTKAGKRHYNLIEVVCKGRDRFSAGVDLSSLFLEGEREDGLLHTNRRLPAQPARYSYGNGIWVARFYVFLFKDGYAGVSDTFFPDNVEEFLQSLVPFELPPNPLVWKPAEPPGPVHLGRNAGVVVGYGEEIPVQRVMTTVWSKSQ